MTKKAKDEATFDCHASGRPQPIVKWSRLAGELMPNGGTEYQVCCCFTYLNSGRNCMAVTYYLYTCNMQDVVYISGIYLCIST